MPRALRRLRSLPAVAAVLLAGGGALAQFEGDASGHPADDYRRAAELFAGGRRDEAVAWLYRGQLRYRVHLAARPRLPRDGDPALFASLGEVVGRPVNEYAFGNLAKLVATLDRLLAWHAGHDDLFTPKTRFAHPHASGGAGLRDMRDYVVREGAAIRTARERNGLPNDP